MYVIKNILIVITFIIFDNINLYTNQLGQNYLTNNKVAINQNNNK